jgi:RNA polymerase sigma-70 factor (ECF subfamily)
MTGGKHMPTEKAIENNHIEYTVSPAAAFETYSDMVYRLAFIRTGSRYDADDILSDVFLRLVKNAHKIQSDEHLKSWLIRVTINCSNSFFSRFGRVKNEALLETSGAVYMESNELIPIVLTLPEHQKTIIYMYYFEGYSVEEIGKICSLPVGTVKSRLSRARASLKKILKGEDFDV